MTIPTPPSQANVAKIVGLMCQSVELANSMRLLDAVACLDAGLLLDPGFFPCRLARARMLAEMERFDEALADLNYVLRQAQLPDVLASFAAILEAGMAYVEARLTTNAEDGAAYLLRGNLHWHARNPLAALEDYDRALKLDNSDVAVHVARGNALYNLNRFPDAVAAYERVLDRDQDDALAWYNRGNALQKLGRLSEAIDSYHRAIAVAPDFAEAWLEEAHCRLAQGASAEGWRLYEWRRQTAQLRPAQLISAQPPWLGDVGLEGRTILLWAEQGFGDTIQFARFIPRVADMAGKVILRLPEALRSLLSPLDQRVTIIGEAEPLPRHDFHCPLMSLPLALGVTDDLAPAGASYLRADLALRQAWQVRLGTGERPRIGLTWAGRKAGAAGAYNLGRDIPLDALSPLAELDVQFICLQKELSGAEDKQLANLPAFFPVRQGLDNFAETAALIENLDLVISVDTAIAHLAGALGKPCWLLLRRSGEWRWQLERSDSPWYPSVEIFRQQVEGDWEEVVRRVARALVQRLETSGSERSKSGRQ
jgi:tetratricopeptide (TPR) repeat protein